MKSKYEIDICSSTPGLHAFPKAMVSLRNVTCVNMRKIKVKNFLEGRWHGRLNDMSFVSVSMQGNSLNSLSVTDGAPRPIFGIMDIDPKSTSTSGRFRNWFMYPSDFRGFSQGAIYYFSKICEDILLLHSHFSLRFRVCVRE